MSPRVIAAYPGAAPLPERHVGLRVAVLVAAGFALGAHAGRYLAGRQSRRIRREVAAAAERLGP